MVKLNPRALQKYMALNEVNKSQLSEIANVPVTTITRIMNGYCCQDITAGKLAKALNADFDELVSLWGDQIKELTE